MAENIIVYIGMQVNKLNISIFSVMISFISTAVLTVSLVCETLFNVRCNAFHDVDINKWHTFSFSLLFYINMVHSMVSLKQIR